MSDTTHKPDVHVSDAPERSRFEVYLDGELAGFAEYWRRPGVIAFTHTVVDDRFEGHGLGSRLIGAALSKARSKGLAVLPFCPFVRSYIEEHAADVLDIVPVELRKQFGLEAAS